MSTVVMHSVVSVDGFIADVKDQVGPLFDWYGNGEVALTEGGPFRVSQASANYVKPIWASIGVIVVGRHLFDITNGWEGQPPTGDHVVVVSHRPRPDGWHPEASYYFAGDVAQAIAKAKELAGPERIVAVAAGEVGGQALALAGRWNGDHHDGVPIHVLTHHVDDGDVPPGSARFYTDVVACATEARAAT